MAQISIPQFEKHDVHLGDVLAEASRWWVQIDKAPVVSRYKSFLDCPDLEPYRQKESRFYEGCCFRFNEAMRHKYFLFMNRDQSDETLRAKYVAIVDEIESFYQAYLVKTSWSKGTWMQQKEADTPEGRKVFFQKLFDVLLPEEEHEHRKPVDIEALACRLQECRLAIERVNASKKQKATLFLNYAFDQLYVFCEKLKKGGYLSNSVCDRDDSYLQKVMADNRGYLVAWPGMFGKWKNLTWLRLFSSSFSTLPPYFAKSFARLERLNMQNGLFSNSVISSLSHIRGLRFLDLTDNPHITKVSADIAQLVNLEGLKLANTSIQSLPPEIGNLSCLEYLSLEMRPQRAEPFQLPAEIGGLASLKKLNLEGLSLAALPESFAELRALVSVSLNYNRLTILPSWVQNWQKLKSLTLSGNETLESLPREMITLDALSNFIMAGRVNSLFFSNGDKEMKAWIKGVRERFQQSFADYINEWDKNSW